jgi:Ca2+-binding RTX toxin-like protein
MRRATLLLLATIAAMLMATGVAIAVTKTCPSGTTPSKPCNGTPDRDVLTGTGGTDYINSLAGDDVIDARAGDDTLYGGDGADALFGKDGGDTIYGGSGNDNFKTIVGQDSSGSDLSAGLRGAKGNDTIYGDAGDDDLIGNAGMDKLYDHSSSNDWDRAFGGTEKDYINVADGDVSDEVSCGIDTAPDDEAKITVTYGTTSDGKIDRTKIEAADKVYDCELLTDQDGYTINDQSKLPQNQPTSASYDTTAPAEPTA